MAQYNPATFRKTIGATATALNVSTATSEDRLYRIYNNSAQDVYIAETKTSGALIETGDNITAVATDYLTIPSGKSSFYRTNNPAKIFGQSASGTVAIEIVPLW